MAKQKKQPDQPAVVVDTIGAAADLPGPPVQAEPPAEQPPLGPTVITALDVPPAEPEPEPPAESLPAGARRYKVELAGVRPAVVEADSPEQAWDRFRAFHGIIASDHAPEIDLVTE